MSDREKLIELIAKAKYICAHDYSDHTEDEYIADMLLDNGVTVGVDAKPLKQYLTQIDEYAGLKLKFLVFKSDTGERIENCFVLRPDKDPKPYRGKWVAEIKDCPKCGAKMDEECE